MSSHTPVMLSEVLEYLRPQAGDYFLDGTLGAAGYMKALAEAVGPKGIVLATDLDQAALDQAQLILKEKNLNNVILIRDNFKNLKEVVQANFPKGRKFQGLVLDLGLSSTQLADETRGFSFQGERPLDMAYGESDKSTAEIINRYPVAELTKIFKEYGEERFAYQIAKNIVAARKKQLFKTTSDLVAVILSSLPARFRASRLNPATKVFQALRLETNDELESLRQVLPVALELLAPEGRLVIVSFHSGEDRIVKNFFRDNKDQALKILTKKPLSPTREEITRNPRARSAKLRAAQKI